MKLKKLIKRSKLPEILARAWDNKREPCIGEAACAAGFGRGLGRQGIDRSWSRVACVLVRVRWQSWS
jgi:hypothetical protein